MDDNLNDILYGKIEKITLADGKEYEFCEPDLATLEEAGVNFSDITSSMNVKKLSYAMFKAKNPNKTEKQFCRLITLSVLNGTEFNQKISKLSGIETSTDSPKKV